MGIDLNANILITADDRASRVLKRLTQGFKPLRRQAFGLNRDMKGLARAGFGSVLKGGKSLLSMLFSLKAAFVSLGAVLFIKSLISTASEFENLRIQLDALEGSAVAGGVALEWVKEFAQTTPLSLQQVTRSFVTMKAFGLDPMGGQMLKLVDASSKLGGGMQRMTSIVRAVGQMFTKGKIQAEEMNRQLTEVGVPAWDLLSKKMGLNVATLQDMASKGQLGRKEILLLIDAIGEFGAGAALANMKAFSGIWTNFIDQISQAKDEFAGVKGGILDLSKAILGELTSSIETLRNRGDIAEWGLRFTQVIISSIKTSVRAFGELLVVFDKVLNAFDFISKMDIRKKINELGLERASIDVASAFTFGEAGIKFKNDMNRISIKMSILGDELARIEKGAENRLLGTETKIQATISALEDIEKRVDKRLKGIIQERIGQEILEEAQKKLKSSLPTPPIKTGSSLIAPTADQGAGRRSALNPGPTDAIGISEDQALLESFNKRQEMIQNFKDFEAQSISTFRLESDEFTRLANDVSFEIEREHLQRLFELDQETGQKRLDKAKELEAAKKAVQDAALQNTLSAASAGFNAIFVLSGSKSKGLFKITKALSIGEATVSAFNAANKGLATGTAPNYPLYAATLLKGLGTVARISKTKLGGGTPSGGGGGSTGTASSSVSVPTGFPTAGQFNSGGSSRQNVTINLNYQALNTQPVDDETKKQIAIDLMPAISDALGGHLVNGGSTGEIELNFTTRGA